MQLQYGRRLIEKLWDAALAEELLTRLERELDSATGKRQQSV